MLGPRAAGRYLTWGGIFYLLLWLYGMGIAEPSFNVLPVNAAGSWLHFSLGLGMISTRWLVGARARGNMPHWD